MAGKKIGLLIGNGSFGATSGFAPLRCPANDVEGLARLLVNEKHGGFEVRTLVDRKHEEIAVALLEVLRDTVGSDDTVVVYYSGHGSPDEDGNLILAAADTTKRALDATGLALEYVVKWMRRARSQKIVLILDCCFSGSVERLFTRGETADQVRAALPKEFSGTGMYVLTASTATQVAEEKEGDEYGLLTKHILRGIGEGHADSNEDGVVTMHELTVYVQEAVKQEGRQEPLGFALRVGGGEMEIARTGRAAMAAKREEVKAAIWRAGSEFYVPERVTLCVLGLISEEVLEEGGELARQRLNQLHRSIGDSSRFVQKLHDFYGEEKGSEEYRKRRTAEKRQMELAAEEAQKRVEVATQEELRAEVRAAAEKRRKEEAAVPKIKPPLATPPASFTLRQSLFPAPQKEPGWIFLYSQSRVIKICTAILILGSCYVSYRMVRSRVTPASLDTVRLAQNASQVPAYPKSEIASIVTSPVHTTGVGTGERSNVSRDKTPVPTDSTNQTKTKKANNSSGTSNAAPKTDEPSTLTQPTILSLTTKTKKADGSGLGEKSGDGVENTAPKGTAERPGPVRVPGGVMVGGITSRTNPVYPAVAKAAHVSGSVVLHAIISKTGAVENLTAVSGPELLRSSAVDAVKTWRYKPYFLNGEPTEVDTTITVNFQFGGP